MRKSLYCMCANQYSLGDQRSGYVVLGSADAPEGQGAGGCLMLMGGLLASVFGSVLCWYLLFSCPAMCNISVLYAREKAILEGLSASPTE